MVQTCSKLWCSTVAVLGHAGDMPVVVTNRCLGFDSAENCGDPAVAVLRRSLSSLVVVQGAIPMVFLLGRPWRLRSCSIFLVVDAPVQCCRALTVAIPQVQFLVLLMTCLSLCYDRCRVRQCRKPCWCRSCVRGSAVPRVQSVRRQPSSHSCTCLFHAWTRSFTRPLCATTDAWWFRVQQTAMSPQLQCSVTVSRIF